MYPPRQACLEDLKVKLRGEVPRFARRVQPLYEHLKWGWHDTDGKAPSVAKIEGKHTSKGKFETMLDNYRTVARWEKAIQHLNESGRLENSPRDIGPLIKEI